MLEIDPVAKLRMFPGSAAEQVIALTDLWRQRSKRTFVAIRERMNELEDLDVNLEPAAFDNYFRRSNREKTPEAVVWGLIRVMRDDAWLPKEQQCTLAEALYLATLKNVSVVTYARLYRLFSGQEEEFKQLCPLGDIIAEKAQAVAQSQVADEEAPRLQNGPNAEISADPTPTVSGFALWTGLPRAMKVAVIFFLIIFSGLVFWMLVSAVGWGP